MKTDVAVLPVIWTTISNACHTHAKMVSLNLIQEWCTALSVAPDTSQRRRKAWHPWWHGTQSLAALEWHSIGSGRGSTCFHGDSTSIPTTQNNLTHSPFIPYGVCNTSQRENGWTLHCSDIFVYTHHFITHTDFNLFFVVLLKHLFKYM